MVTCRRSIVFVLLLLVMKGNAQSSSGGNFFNWSQASAIPDANGFAGSYAGVSNGVLLVAGGANFPDDKRPWTNGIKTWYDQIFMLEKPGAEWKEVGKLPRPMAYGVSLTCADGLICLGGGDANQNYADVFILKYVAGKIETVQLPSLPSPLSNASGAVLNNVVYIIGGIYTPSGLTENSFWSLDLSARTGKWKVLDLLPGPSRMFSIAGAQEDNVYVFGGAHLKTSGSALQR